MSSSWRVAPRAPAFLAFAACRGLWCALGGGCDGCAGVGLEGGVWGDSGRVEGLEVVTRFRGATW
jgi:hypothetical protein